ncbi:hypothetical protein EBO15_04995 [Actinomadura harenae]|uniref:Uncharacterized protein n=1 Tax=Actinomadura harenae TaxID=2483351 RepID=A0A3M2MBV1_9ACTN|nr:hypothetical protein EBO15_04995 [Actinomadura harenae]
MPERAAPGRSARDRSTRDRSARLRAALRESDARVEELERRLAALETSTTVQFGRLVAGAARNPRRRAARLPRELYKLWKKRDRPMESATLRESASRRLDRFDRPEDRLLVQRPSDRPVVAGILGRDAAAELAHRYEVVAIHPHDVRTVLETADVDALVVDACAGEPGGAWAYLGVPGMFDRDRDLDEARGIARVRDIPVVLWGDNPPPTLAVLDWDPVATLKELR